MSRPVHRDRPRHAGTCGWAPRWCRRDRRDRRRPRSTSPTAARRGRPAAASPPAAVPNTDGLDLEHAGVDVDDDGRVVVDAHQRTNVDGVWALGDVSSPLPAQARRQPRGAGGASTTCCTPRACVEVDHRHVPRAVFSYPQVASVGLTEEQGRAQGVALRRRATRRTATRRTAGRWRTPPASCKLVADPRTGLLLGAHLIGPQASSLIQPLIQAMAFGQTAHEMARASTGSTPRWPRWWRTPCSSSSWPPPRT